MPYLAAEGIICDVWPFTTPELYRVIHGHGQLVYKAAATIVSFARRLEEVVRARNYDCIVVVREILPFGPPLLEVLLGRGTHRMVVDFDDAIFLSHPEGAPDNSLLYRLKYGRQFDLVLKAARSVIAGNEYLADYARRHNPNVGVIPTVLDLHKYTPRPFDGSDEGPVVIGWTGSSSTARHLRRIGKVVLELCERYGDRIRFVILGDPTFPRLAPQVIVKPFNLDSEVHDLHEFDVGLMPLITEEWSLGKCAAKALQYWSSGIPVVSSPVGVAASIVEPGVNGFLATTHEEWMAALTSLIEDRALRRSMGRRGRERVEEEYSITAQLPTMVSVLRNAADSRLSTRTETR